MVGCWAGRASQATARQKCVTFEANSWQVNVYGMQRWDNSSFFHYVHTPLSHARDVSRLSAPPAPETLRNRARGPRTCAFMQLRSIHGLKKGFGWYIVHVYQKLRHVIRRVPHRIGPGTAASRAVHMRETGCFEWNQGRPWPSYCTRDRPERRGVEVSAGSLKRYWQGQDDGKNWGKPIEKRSKHVQMTRLSMVFHAFLIFFDGFSIAPLLRCDASSSRKWAGLWWDRPCSTHLIPWQQDGWPCRQPFRAILIRFSTILTIKLPLL